MTYASLRDKIRAESAQRAARYAEYAQLYDAAMAAGDVAAQAATPEPMVVVQPSDPLNDTSPPKQVWVEREGPCGFASVTIFPGNSSFARWLVKNRLGGRQYGGGVGFSINGYNQSMTRKYAAACAIADVLQGAGIEAYAESRMD